MRLIDDIEWQDTSDQLDFPIGLGVDLFDFPEAELDDEGLISCPLVPLRDMVMYPHMVTPLFVGRERSVAAVGAAALDSHRLIVVAQRDGGVHDPHPEDLYAVGTEVVIARTLRMPEGTLTVLAQGRRRVCSVGAVHSCPCSAAARGERVLGRSQGLDAGGAGAVRKVR
jgi:hypothetical protein